MRSRRSLGERRLIFRCEGKGLGSLFLLIRLRRSRRYRFGSGMLFVEGLLTGVISICSTIYNDPVLDGAAVAFGEAYREVTRKHSGTPEGLHPI
jgi:hypothetical protein